MHWVQTSLNNFDRICIAPLVHSISTILHVDVIKMVDSLFSAMELISIVIQ